MQSGVGTHHLATKRVFNGASLLGGHPRGLAGQLGRGRRCAAGEQSGGQTNDRSSASVLQHPLKPPACLWRGDSARSPTNAKNAENEGPTASIDLAISGRVRRWRAF
jgi:hypothetical protein